MARRKERSTAENRAEGRQAHHPSQIPAKGWWQIALRVKDEVSSDNISIIAAGIAFYGLLAIFPGIAALVSIYGQENVDRWRAGARFDGYRVGIRENGGWYYFAGNDL